MTKSPLVSIVIVNWNGIDDTLTCIASVKELDYRNVEIIVVDNGSEDGSVGRLEGVEGIILSKLPRNTGFTGGHLEGLRMSTGEYIALLNNDLVVAKDWLTKLMDTMTANRADIAGGRSYHWGGDNPSLSTNNPYSSYQVVNPTTGHTLTCSYGQTTSEVNAISGSNLLVSRRLIDDIGYLDPTFFAYYEETDLIARAKRAGYKALYVPGAHVWHKIGASTRHIPYFYFYYMHRNRFAFAVKNFDSSYLTRFLLYYTREMLLSVRSFFRNRDSLYDRAMIQAWVYAFAHFPVLLARRSSVMKLGKTYSQKLLRPIEANQTVTVTIPCYNYAKFVIEAIESVAHQTLRPAKILIINDGSTDDSQAVISNWLEGNETKYPDIEFEYIKQANVGIIATKNRAIELIETDWHIFLDADDILDESYIEKTVYLGRKTNSDLVYTDMEFFGSQDGVQKVCKYHKYRLRAMNFIHNSALIRTSLLRRTGGYSPEMHMGYEDWELYLRMSKLRPHAAYLELALLKYRRHESASRDISAQQKLPEVVKILESLHPELYNLRFYVWLELSRAAEASKVIIKAPFSILKHIYSHTFFKAKNKLVRKLSTRVVTGKRKEN